MESLRRQTRYGRNCEICRLFLRPNPDINFESVTYIWGEKYNFQYLTHNWGLIIFIGKYKEYKKIRASVNMTVTSVNFIDFIFRKQTHDSVKIKIW